MGARTVEQLRGDLAAAEPALSAARTARLNGVSAPPPGLSAGLTAPSVRRMVFGGHDVLGWAE